MVAFAVRAIEIEGHTSIRKARVELGRINVLVGANGAGKSNFIRALELLGRIADSQLSTYVAKQGGASLLFDRRNRGDRLRLALDVPPDGYEVILEPTADDEVYFASEGWKVGGMVVPVRGGHRESRLCDSAMNLPLVRPTVERLLELLRGCRVYHFHDTGQHSPIKAPAPSADNLGLHGDGGNVASVLARLRGSGRVDDEAAFRRITGAPRRMAGGLLARRVVAEEPHRWPPWPRPARDRVTTTYRRIHFLVEGQTEETIVRAVFVPYFEGLGWLVTFSILRTKRPVVGPASKGGVVAARAAMYPGFSLATLAEQLHQTRGGLQAFEGGEVGDDVRAVFSWSYQRLDSMQARLFRLLGLHPGPDITAAAAASLAGADTTQVRRALAELARCHLVEELVPGRFGFHSLLRAYATELIGAHDTHDEQHAARQRMLDHYLHTAHAAELLLRPRWDPITIAAPAPGVAPEKPAEHKAAMAWFEAEYAVLLATVQLAAVTGHHTHAWQLPSVLSEFFIRRWRWADYAATETTALDAAQRHGDRHGQAHAHRSLGLAMVLLGRYDQAHDHLRQAIDLFAELDDPVGQAQSYFTLSSVLGSQGNLADALAYAQRALELFHAAGSLPEQARALNKFGYLHALLGKPQQTLAHCQQARTLNQKVGDRRLEADTMDSLGYAHHLLGQHHLAIDHLQQSTAIYRELGARHNLATSLDHLGDAHHAADDRDAARKAWQQALDILDQLGVVRVGIGSGLPDADQINAKLHRFDAPDSRSPRR